MQVGHSIYPDSLIRPDQSPELAEKGRALGEWFTKSGRVLVAFSGGVDSALVAFAARSVRGQAGVRAFIADSPSLPRRELAAAMRFASEHDIGIEVVATREGEHSAYMANEGDRCYYCKQELYAVLDYARTSGEFDVIVNGSNADDPGEWRPGLQAADEMDIRSPLLELGFTKQDVRELSQSLELETWEKPALPCLASRIPYGQKVTPEKLARIEAAEEILWEEGFRVFRVRHHGHLARLEIGEDERARLEETGLRDCVFEAIHSCGFESVELDPEPYRRGNLNDALDTEGHGIPASSPLQVRLPTDS
jgi:uncharacterized protein